ncbi:hypothetical protein IFM89_016125 [Coptis chinensis]|uniref:Uncharacterized protein n=1 Tax=Coptis chinensis TaxID=261450 RepID=A0A835LEF6_9MAGN|nr:hypothetical protein IFM89_016125 [Coptis chinensis]
MGGINREGSLAIKRPRSIGGEGRFGFFGLTALRALTKSAVWQNLEIRGVLTTCGARNIDLVKSLGADEILDYKTLMEWSLLKSPSGRKYDAMIQRAFGIPWSTFEPNLSERGKVIDITPGPSSIMTYR